MKDNCPFSESGKCEIWIDYQILQYALEEAEELADVIQQIKKGLDSRFILGYLKDVLCRPVILFYAFSADYLLTN